MTVRPLSQLSSEDCAALIGRKVRTFALNDSCMASGFDDRTWTVLNADRREVEETAWHGDTRVAIEVSRPGESETTMFYDWTGTAENWWGIEVIDEPEPTLTERTEQTGTIWDRTGIAMVDRVGDFLYHRVRVDPELWEIFRHLPVGAVRAKFKLWLTAKLGGPSSFAGDMGRHKAWPITDRMFEKVLDYVLAGFLCEHVSREDLATIEGAARAERGSVVSA